MNKPILILKSTAVKSTFLALAFACAFATSGFAAAADSCAVDPANRKFDYWLGNWRVGSGSSPSNAHSNVTLSLDKCLVVENWNNGAHHGRNIFGYSSDDKNWYGMFADNEGRVHVFTSGNVAQGEAEFEGTSRGPHGESILNRVKVIRLNPDKVEQTWEKSNDKGVTWNIVFRGEYSREHP